MEKCKGEASLLEAIAARWTPSPAGRYGLMLGSDAAATLVSFYGAVRLWAGASAPDHLSQLSDAALLLVALRVSLAYIARLHRWSFRMSGLTEAARIVQATLMGSAVFSLVASEVPLPLVVVEFFFTTSLMAAYRFAPRIVDGWYWDLHHWTNPAAPRTIIVGAGATGALLVRDLLCTHNGKYYVVGFVDDSASTQGSSVAGKPVLGRIDDLPRLLAEHDIAFVLLAIPSLPAMRIRNILKLCAASKAKFKKVPGSYSHVDERVSAAMLHDLSPDDLLPRDPVAFDQREIRALVHGKRVLVTGAAGSIGSEICRQLGAHGVSEVVMVDMNENELYLGARKLQTDHPTVNFYSEVADIREFERLQRLCMRYRPELVFHAAAHKHVPLMEDAPEEAIKNNVFGTLNVATIAQACGAERLVMISTDKAVNPTSVMGATKRVAELVVRDLARRSTTKMTAVRFGNVLGSAGSVVPLFKQQIERGGPVTVTHPECTRYFMTVSEAVGLVLLAGLGGYGDLCVLDMGEPIRIADVAANLITLAGRVPGAEIPIVYTGLRPGEKLYEELLTEEEEETAQVRNRINVAKSPPPPDNLARVLHDLRELADAGDTDGIMDALTTLVPTFRRTPARVLPVPARNGKVAEHVPMNGKVAGHVPMNGKVAEHGKAAPEHPMNGRVVPLRAPTPTPVPIAKIEL